MKITMPPRGPEERRHDVLARLEGELDVWVASANTDGLPCLVPLWFVWDGEAVWLCTRPTNPTGRNLGEGRRTRLAFADTRDVVLVDGETTAFTAEDVPAAAAADAFDAKYGWDPREDRAAYSFFQVRPLAVQAWHEVRELPGRHLMRDGVWLV
ncbi:pyridoxamine 5'-phosphate oxidase family protein [Streptomyces sp. NPDC001100]